MLSTEDIAPPSTFSLHLAFMRRLLAGCLPLLLAHCAWNAAPPPAPSPVFHVNASRYATLKPADARITVDLTAQKARLLDRDGAIAVETDVSTGKPGHDTPVGTFRISEKIADKRSNLYGRYRDSKSGLDLGPSTDHPKPPKDAVYEGYSMPYWMRLTRDGVGIHVGHVVPGKAASFGCIRVPAEVQPLIFDKSRVGTPVEIANPPADVAPARPLAPR
jgi:lipoprotein-anchoring transpeptidase ErfK/SrfK